MTTIFIGLF